MKTLSPGIILCTIIGIIAMGVSAQYGMPVMMLAILLGLGLHSLLTVKNLEAGINWSSKSLLYIGVALLGLRIDLSVLSGAGWVFPAFALTLLFLTLILGYFIGHLMSGDKYFAILMGSAVAVCGVSAAAAVCCSLPKCDRRDGQMAITVGGITVLSTIAMLLYPLAATTLNLTDAEAGILMGGTIHNVSQAVGAGYSVSENAGDIATLVKLIRVAALLPVIIAISLIFNKSPSGTKQSWTTYFPPFLLAFFFLAACQTVGWIPPAIDAIGRHASEFCLIVSLVAIGMKTDMKQLVLIGTKPLIAMGLTTLIMAGLALVGLSFLPTL